MQTQDITAFVKSANIEDVDIIEQSLKRRRKALISSMTVKRQRVMPQSKARDSSYVNQRKTTSHFSAEKIMTLARKTATAADVAGKTQVRVLLTGCFDVMHAGHYNALRQAKCMFASFGVQTWLVAGVHSSMCIEKQKGKPVMSDEERQQLVATCKWVDEVVCIPEYMVSLEFLDSHNCDFVAHGDDLPTRKGEANMIFHDAIVNNRFRMIKRTEGVSTTSSISRMLHTAQDSLPCKNASGVMGPAASLMSDACSSVLLPTCSRIAAFAHGMQPVSQSKRVVYVDGVFDVFHVGHVNFLRRARALGDFLLVGLHSDEIARQQYGRGYPVMSLHERALCLMSNKFVDDVIIGAPWAVTHDLCTSMNVSAVVTGHVSATKRVKNDRSGDRYHIPKALGLFHVVDSGSTLATQTIMQRIVDNYAALKQRNEVQDKKAMEYLQNKTYFQEHTK